MRQSLLRAAFSGELADPSGKAQRVDGKPESFADLQGGLYR